MEETGETHAVHVEDDLIQALAPGRQDDPALFADLDRVNQLERVRLVLLALWRRQAGKRQLKVDNLVRLERLAVFGRQEESRIPELESSLGRKNKASGTEGGGVRWRSEVSGRDLLNELQNKTGLTLAPKGLTRKSASSGFFSRT